MCLNNTQAGENLYLFSFLFACALNNSEEQYKEKLKQWLPVCAGGGATLRQSHGGSLLP